MSTGARDWIEECSLYIKAMVSCFAGSKEYPILGKVSLEVQLHTTRDMDLDNVLKPICDLLSKHSQIIGNDSLITELHAFKHRVKKDNQKAVVVLTEL